MKNLLNKLVKIRRKTVRVRKNPQRELVSYQIARMGKMGQTLIVMSR